MSKSVCSLGLQVVFSSPAMLHPPMSTVEAAVQLCLADEREIFWGGHLPVSHLGAVMAVWIVCESLHEIGGVLQCLNPAASSSRLQLHCIIRTRVQICSPPPKKFCLVSQSYIFFKASMTFGLGLSLDWGTLFSSRQRWHWPPLSQHWCCFWKKIMLRLISHILFLVLPCFCYTDVFTEAFPQPEK